MEIKLIKIDNESYFVYQSSRKVYKERVADIMYFARGGRRVTMHSRESGEIELYCSLVEIYRVLITEGFHYINQSVLINISYITNIKKNLAKVCIAMAYFFLYILFFRLDMGMLLCFCEKT